MKQCKKCLQTLKFTEFYKHSKMLDGYLSFCKSCVKIRVKIHRNNNLEKVRNYDRERAKLPHRKKASVKITQLYRGKYPERYKANNALNNAIRDGLILKLPCFVCGDSKTVGHHPDYDRSLDVIWLCQKHHAEIHLKDHF